MHSALSNFHEEIIYIFIVIRIIQYKIFSNFFSRFEIKLIFFSCSVFLASSICFIFLIDLSIYRCFENIIQLQHKMPFNNVFHKLCSLILLFSRTILSNIIYSFIYFNINTIVKWYRDNNNTICDISY